MTHAIRVELPAHLRTLAGVGAEVVIDVDAPVSPKSVISALEARYPMLAGTMRDHTTHKRRAFVRFFACGQDISLDSADTPLHADIISGKEPFLIVGAIAGG